MGHTPYGYKIENGHAVIDEEQALNVKTLFEGYIGGLGLKAAAEAAGIHVTHCQAKRMMLNEKYLGTEYYPALVTEDIVKLAKERMEKQEERFSRGGGVTKKESRAISKRFYMPPLKEKKLTPFEQAAYAYSQIREVE